MTETKTHHATLRLARDYQFLATFDDLPEAEPILFDEPPPLGHDRAPNAAAVLSAAIGNCLSASLAFCLRRARLEPTRLTTHVATHLARNERGRYRIKGIDVEIAPEFRDGDMPRLARCEELFEDFCTVTASVREGIPVRVSLKSPESGDSTATGVGAPKIGVRRGPMASTEVGMADVTCAGMPRELIDQITRSAERIFTDRRGRLSAEAVWEFAEALALVPTTPYSAHLPETIATLRALCERVIMELDGRIEQTYDSPRLQTELAWAVHDIRLLLEKIDRWVQHYRGTSSNPSGRAA